MHNSLPTRLAAPPVVNLSRAAYRRTACFLHRPHTRVKLCSAPATTCCPSPSRGSAFVASFIASALKGSSNEKCLEAASAAGTISTRRPGAQSSLPVCKDLDMFLSNDQRVVASPLERLPPLHQRVLRCEYEFEYEGMELSTLDAAQHTPLERAWECCEMVRLSGAVGSIRHFTTFIWRLLVAQLVLTNDPLSSQLHSELRRLVQLAMAVPECPMPEQGDSIHRSRWAVAAMAGLQASTAHSGAEAAERNRFVSSLVSHALGRGEHWRDAVLSNTWTPTGDWKELSLLLLAAKEGNIALLTILMSLELPNDQKMDLTLRHRLMALASAHPKCEKQLFHLMQDKKLWGPVTLDVDVVERVMQAKCGTPPFAPTTALSPGLWQLRLHRKCPWCRLQSRSAYTTERSDASSSSSLE